MGNGQFRYVQVVFFHPIGADMERLSDKIFLDD